MKILITYAYAGVGHKKAADAVYGALLGLKGIDVENIDVLDYTNKFFKFSYPRVYLFLINRVPYVWGLLYYLLDFSLIDRFLAPLRGFFHNLQSKRFIKYILQKKPDLIISTHFLPAEVVSGLKKKNIFKGILITIITDFLAHSFWMNKNSDYFITAIEKTRRDLMKRGVGDNRIKVLGIPCESKFSVSKDRITLMKKLDLQEGLFNLIIMGGGFGTGPVKEIIYSICSLMPQIRERLQIIAICGKNKKLFKELNNAKSSLKVKLCVFGYMNNIDEFMEVSNLIVTKSGGLTATEALSKKLPMIIISPIPGQETRNCTILSGYGTAVRADTVNQVRDFVEDFITLPEKIIGMKTRINLLSFPDAAKNIAEFVLKI